MTAQIVQFVPKANLKRDALIREAKKTYDQIFPAYPEMLLDTAPCEYVAEDTDPA